MKRLTILVSVGSMTILVCIVGFLSASTVYEFSGASCVPGANCANCAAYTVSDSACNSGDRCALFKGTDLTERDMCVKTASGGDSCEPDPPSGTPPTFACTGTLYTCPACVTSTSRTCTLGSCGCDPGTTNTPASALFYYSC